MHYPKVMRPAPVAKIAAMTAMTAVLCSAGLGQSASATNPLGSLTRIMDQPVTRLIETTNDLYYVYNYTTAIEEGQVYFHACVLRAPKSAPPGRVTTVTCVNPSVQDARVEFGSLTYAYVDSTWYGYVVVNDYPTVGKSQIRRFPLAGGSSVALASTLGYIGARDLITDGATLFWCDATAVRAMSVKGGTVTSRIAGKNLSKLGLDRSRLYYTTGHSIASIPKAPGQWQPTLEVDAATDITSMDVQLAASTVLYFGEWSGAVRSHAVGSHATTTYQAAGIFHYIVSVSFDGSRVLWIDFDSNTATYYEVEWNSGTRRAIAQGPDSTVDIQGDKTATFWGGAAGLWRYTY